MTRYKVRDGFWLYLIRTWLFQPGEIVDLTPDEATRYAAQIEEVVQEGTNP